jgi:hypothetical protein
MGVPVFSEKVTNLVRGGRGMGRKVFKPEQIIGKLREAEVLLNQSHTVGEINRELGKTGHTLYLGIG